MTADSLFTFQDRVVLHQNFFFKNCIGTYVNIWDTTIYRTLCKEPAAWMKLAESNDDRAILHREKTFHCFVSCVALIHCEAHLWWLDQITRKKLRLLDHYETTSMEFYIYYTLYMYFFFLDELRKFTISDFPKQTHLGYTFITLFFSYTL